MMPFSPRRFTLWVGAALLGLAVVLAVSPGIGTRQDIGLLRAWDAAVDPDSHRTVYEIAFHLRLPRTLLALLAGMTLALCGAVFQTLFRNPLATPYTLGIASGGSLGALVGDKLGLIGSLLGFSYITVSAFGGAAAVVIALFVLAGGTRRLGGNALLLAGVTVGLFCGAMMMFVTYLADVTETYRIVRWMMGSVAEVGTERILGLLPALLPCWLALLWQARALNQFELGDELAASRGVQLRRMQAVCIVCASLATAAVVSVCGPIGFVGLIVPHAVRALAGNDRRLLLPVAALAGGMFLIVCDWLTALVPRWYGSLAGRDITAARLPIGVMTALIGAPVFLVILRRRLR